jgi:HEAT repeat protein
MLLEMLDDPVHAVRAGAQQALLHGDASITEAVCEYLWSGPRRGTNLALEVAATLPDPRYGAVLRHYADDPDPIRRAMVARAVGAGAMLDSAQTLAGLLDDDDPDVRAAAAMAVCGLQRVELASALGRMLADSAWVVRRTAALALAELGPPGSVVLRAHLFDDDRYARDMARQVLDAAATRRRLRRVIVPDELPPLDDVSKARLA